MFLVQLHGKNPGGTPGKHRDSGDIFDAETLQKTWTVKPCSRPVILITGWVMSAAQLGLNKLNQGNPINQKISICDKYVRDNSEKKRLPHHSAASPLFHHSNVMEKSGKIWDNDMVDAVDVASMGVRKMKNTHFWTFEKHFPRHVICHNFAPWDDPQLVAGLWNMKKGPISEHFQTSKSKQYIWYSTFAFGWICDQCIDIIVVPDLKRTKLNNWSYIGFKKMNEQRNDNLHLQGPNPSSLTHHSPYHPHHSWWFRSEVAIFYPTQYEYKMSCPPQKYMINNLFLLDAGGQLSQSSLSRGYVLWGVEWGVHWIPVPVLSRLGLSSQLASSFHERNLAKKKMFWIYKNKRKKSKWICIYIILHSFRNINIYIYIYMLHIYIYYIYMLLYVCYMYV